MKTRHSIFWKNLAAFMLFAFILSCFSGFLIFLAVEHFKVFLVQEQVVPVMTALVESEKQHRFQKDNSYTKKIAHSLNGRFFVGKRVPDDIRELGYGLHLDGNDFTYLVNDEGIMYALTGSSKAFQIFLADISGIVVLGCCLGLALASIMALFLSRQLSYPLIHLAKAIRNAIPGECSIPLALAERKDETGLLASSMLDFQKDAKEYYIREANFAGDISHELRTPLAVLSGSIEILSSRLKNGSPHEKEHLARIERAIEQMSSSVRSVLALARKNVTSAEYIDMNVILAQEISRLQTSGLCAKKKITVHSRNVLVAYGHADLASTALGNLLANACHYSANNHVHVRIGPYFISVSNMIMDTLPESAGYRLGLSIVQRCCEKMGWQFRMRPASRQMRMRISWCKPEA